MWKTAVEIIKLKKLNLTTSDYSKTLNPLLLSPFPPQNNQKQSYNNHILGERQTILGKKKNSSCSRYLFQTLARIV